LRLITGDRFDDKNAAVEGGGRAYGFSVVSHG
jgi:hypothetical protein